MRTRFLSSLLWLANSNPPHLCRREFYAVKDRILRRFGERDATPHDWQHIVRECYACDGAGGEDSFWGGYRCYRCSGTGVYDEAWIKLERWRLGDRVFHRPAGRFLRPTDEVGTVIEGFVEHARTGRAPAFRLPLPSPFVFFLFPAGAGATTSDSLCIGHRRGSLAVPEHTRHAWCGLAPQLGQGSDPS